MLGAPTGHARNPWVGVALGLALVVLTALFRGAIGFQEGDAALVVMFVVPALLATYLGSWPGGLAATVSAAIIAPYFFMAPVRRLTIGDAADRARWLALVGVNLLVTLVVEAVRRSHGRIASRERMATETANLLRILVANAPVSVAMFDRQMRYLAASERYLSDYGMSPESLGRSHYEIFPEIPERWKEIHRRCLAGAVERCEEEPFPRADGSMDWVRWELRPWRDDAGDIGGLVLLTERITERKRAQDEREEALARATRASAEAERARERLEVTLRSIGDAVIATDAGARITLMNPAAEVLTGWASSEAMGRPLEEVFRIVDEISRRPGEDPVQRVLGEGRVVGLANHTLLLARNGAEHPVADSGAPIRDPGGQVLGVVLVFRDLTPEREADEAMRARRALEEQVARIASSVPGLIHAFRRRGDGSLCFPFMIPAAEEVLGIPGQELARDVSRFFANLEPADRPRMAADMEQSAREMSRYHEAFRYHHPAKGLRWLEIWSEPVAEADGGVTWHGYMADVTANRRAVEELQRSEERFRALIENSSDVVVVLDAERRVSFFSPSAAEQLGWTDLEAVQRGWAELVHPDDRGRSRELEQGALAAQGITVHFVRRQLHHGSSRLVDVSVRNLLHDPAVRGVVYTFRDITEQRRLNEQIQQSQKLESIGRLAGGVAHDFNNLLTVILSCCTTLDDELGNAPAAARDDVAQIRAAGERARDLTRQLLAFARKQVIAPIALDLNAVLRGSQRLLGRLLGEDVTLEVVPFPELWAVQADPGQLEQVIVNLAVNARDAMPAGGTLRLETHNVIVGADEAGRPPERRPGDWVRLAVRDTGVGMTEEVRAHLFEPFFTTKAKGKGTGLGLATVYGIVEQAGGHLHVQSEPDRGTLVDIWLPRAAGRPGQPEPAAASPGDGHGSETVLVAEDDPLVRGVIVRTLRQAGYGVIEARSGAEALALAERESSAVDLVITDVVMPGLNGRALVEELSRRRPGVRALYVSGYSDDVVSHHGVLDPGLELLPKPFTPPALLERVRRVLDRS